MISSAAITHPRHCEHSEAIQNLDCHIAADAPRNDEEDRLVHAKNFAAKLSDSRLREMAKIYRNRWTPARRAEKAQLIQTIKPWTHATGPKSGPRRKGAGYAMHAMKRALRDHDRFLRFAAHWPNMTEKGRRLCFEAGEAATLGILTALAISWCVTERNNE